MRSALLLVASLAASLGCSASSGDDGFGGNGGGTGSNGDSSASGVGGGFATSSSTMGTGAGSGCSAATQLVYVLSIDNDLYSFDPPSKAFVKLGPLSCPTSMQPNSMAIDRNAFAWVNYVQNDGLADTAGTVFKVNTSTLQCEGPIVNLPTNWFRLGMGYATDMKDGTTESLYVAATDNGSPAQGIATISGGALSPVGPFTGPLAGQSAELTGTGDARLFGFFTTTPVQVAEIEKGSGSILSAQQLPAVETPAAWAFSFWGGDFYLYTAPDPNLNPSRTTNVSRYRPSDGTVDPAYMQNIGFIIVGAGVSTCAPIVPPN